MLLTEEQRKVMREEFAIRFGGAMLGALEDAALEGYWKANLAAQGKFPYIQLHPKLAPCDDLIVGGLSIPPWVIGALLEEDGKKKGDMKAREMGKNLKMVGEGDVIYALNMVLHHTIGRLPDPPIWSPAKQVSARSGAGAGTGDQRKTDVGHKIIKL